VRAKHNAQSVFYAAFRHRSLTAAVMLINSSFRVVRVLVLASGTLLSGDCHPHKIALFLLLTSCFCGVYDAINIRLISSPRTAIRHIVCKQIGSF
jgi:hypothetical protein